MNRKTQHTNIPQGKAKKAERLPLGRRASRVALALCLATSLSPITAGLAFASQEDDSFPLQGAATVDYSLEADGIIVVMEDGGLSLLSLLGESAEDQLENAGLEVTGEAESAEGLTLLQAQPNDGQSLQEAVDAAASIKGVAYAQPNYLLDLIEPLTEEDEEGTEGGNDESEEGSEGEESGEDGSNPEGTTPDDEEGSDEEDNANPTPEPDPAPQPGRPLIDATTSLSKTNDPLAQGNTLSGDRSSNRDQYWAYNAGLVEAWSLAEIKEPVTIAVFDSGAMVKHEDLAENILANLAYDAFDQRPLNTSAANRGGDKRSDGHGTHVSGIAGAVTNNNTGISGASHNAATILPVNVVNENKSASVLSIIRAYNYVFDLVDAGACNIRVINLSAGGYTESDNFIMLKALIETARSDYGIVTVCAGGNSSKSETIYPGDYDACVSVTALNNDGSDWILSDHNQFKDISAPGQLICSTVPYVEPASSDDSVNLASSVAASPAELERYDYLSGTSMASPVVAGTLALMFATVPDATVDEALEALYSTATDIPDFDEASGTKGALDAGAALKLLIELTTELEPFPDVEPDDWFYEAVVFVSSNEIMNGYTSGQYKGCFGPNDTLKRSEAAKLLYNYLGGGAIVPACDLPDVKQGAWYSEAINWCVQEGIMGGYTSGPKAGTFGINDTLTREQSATIIARVANADLSDIDYTKFEALSGHENTSNYAKETLSWAVSMGVINGGNDGALNPQKDIKRSEMAKIILNSVEEDVLPAPDEIPAAPAA